MTGRIAGVLRLRALKSMAQDQEEQLLALHVSSNDVSLVFPL